MKSHKLGSARGPPWNVRIHHAARDEILALGAVEAHRVSGKLHELALDPLDPLRPRPGLDVKKLRDTGGGAFYRLRVGERRVLYAAITEDKEVLVLVVEDREVGYGRLRRKAEERLKELGSGNR